jgi:hypothetical protein
MKTFIEHIGDVLLEQISQGNEPVLVLPNKRPLAFLQKYLAKQANKPLWFPKVYTIEDFVLMITQMNLAEPTYTAACLYEIYTATLQDQADSFDDFLKWWSLIIADFNDIDMYMVNSNQLFNYINEAKAIEQWNPGQLEPTRLQQHYLSFWKFLPLFYQELNKKLSAENMGYRGMIYRKAAEILQSQSNSNNRETVIFAGFNALSTSEENIIEHYLKSNQGAIIWESDDYYLKDEKQEAGFFLRHYTSKWKHYSNAICFSNNSLLNDALEINIIGAPKSMMQASKAGQLAKKILEKEPVHAALIPADEELLHPLLYQLPAGYSHQINISMGYPMMALPLNSLYSLIFDCINQLDKDKQNIFNTRLLHQLFSHPYAPLLFMQKSFQATEGDLKKIKQTLLSNGKINYSLPEILSLQKTFESSNFYWLFETLVNNFSNLNSVPEIFMHVNNLLVSHTNELNALKELLLVQVNLYQEVLSDIRQVFFSHAPSIIKQAKTLLSLINQSIVSKTLPFIGNATGGLQFIGLLETRMLQFDEIIITGCNEGILPNAKASGNSFIPYDIRHQFKLPTYKDSEAVFAYHFYRLIQGAKKIHLIYNTETDEFGSGEKSRFLHQLEMEVQLKNKNAILHSEIIKLPALSNAKRKAITFSLNDYTAKNLKALAEKGISATALISYKNCSLQFYFKYLEQIKEPDEISNELGANIVGSVIHAVLEEIYSPLKNQIITLNQIQFPFEILENMTIKAFHKIEQGADHTSGKNLLFIQTAVRIIAKFLNQEQQAIRNGIKLKILHTEEEFNGDLPIPGQTIKLRGKVDRMDEWNHTTRIIDYKTGTVDPAKLKVKSIDEVFENPEYDKAFQLLFYTLLYQKNFPNAKQEVEAGILSLRKISDGLYTLSVTEDFETVMTSFEQNLVHLIGQMFDAQIQFTQTENQDICNFCAYANICMK